MLLADILLQEGRIALPLLWWLGPIGAVVRPSHGLYLLPAGHELQ